MQDIKKAEPAAAATVTDSRENALENISDNIIPENSEIVKTPEKIAPRIIFEALMDKISDEKKRLKEADEAIEKISKALETEKALRKETEEHIRDLYEHITEIGYVPF